MGASLCVISIEALLRASYWFSRDCTCEITKKSDEEAEVSLTPKTPQSSERLEEIREAFLASAMDFALRERVDAKTSAVRDLLLAKAFSESGVLEDPPEGVFGDVIEEEKADGMFKILSNS